GGRPPATGRGDLLPPFGARVGARFGLTLEAPRFVAGGVRRVLRRCAQGNALRRPPAFGDRVTSARPPIQSPDHAPRIDYQAKASTRRVANYQADAGQAPFPGGFDSGAPDLYRPFRLNLHSRPRIYRSVRTLCGQLVRTSADGSGTARRSPLPFRR